MINLRSRRVRRCWRNRIQSWRAPLRQRRRAHKAETESLESRLLLAARLDLQLSETSVSEGAGESAIVATLTRLDPPGTTTALTVVISEDDPDELSFPATVSIPADQTSTTFQIDTINDALVDGTALVNLTAAAVGFDPGTAAVSVTDDDTATQKIIGGQLFGSLARDTYLVSHSISVPAGQQLALQPGTEIRFLSGQSVEVFGQLLAQADAANEILFTSASATPAAGDWAGISFRGESSEPQTVLEHVTVEYAATGIQMAGQGLPVLIESSTIRHSQSAGVLVRRAGPAVNLISNSRIHDNGTHGIDIIASPPGCGSGGMSTGLTLAGSEVDHNGLGGVRMSAGGRGCFPFGSTRGIAVPVISGNRIHSNLDGILGQVSRYGSLRPQIHSNLIYDNLVDGIRLEDSYRLGVNAEVINNTVVRNAAVGIQHPEEPGTDFRLFNNLVADNLQGIATGSGYVVSDEALGYNNVFGNSGGNWINFPAAVGASTITNANGTPADEWFNISVAPDFAADDLHLTLGSSLVSAGGHVPGTTFPLFDFDGDERVSPPDIGADEVSKLVLSFAPAGSGVNTTDALQGIYQIREGAASGTVTADIRRNTADISSAQTVSILNPDSSVFSLPATVTIPEGQRNVSFTFNTVDDGEIEIDTTYTTGGAAGGARTIHTAVRVVDDELLPAEAVAGSERKVNAAQPGNTDASVTAAWISDSRYVVAWRSTTPGAGTDLVAQLFDSTHVPIGNRVVVAALPSAQIEQVPVVSTNGQGMIVIGWTRVTDAPNSQRSVHVQRFDEDLVRIGPEIPMPDGVALADIAVAADEQWHVVYRIGSEVWIQRYQADGTTNGQAFLLTNNGYVVPKGSVYDSDGNIIVVWQDGFSVRVSGRRFGASAGQWGSVFLLASRTGNDNVDRVRVVAVPAGGFLVTWRRGELFDTKTMVGKRFDADGLAVTSEFDVLFWERGPTAVSFSARHEFHAVWSSQAGVVHTQQYSVDGLPRGAPTEITTGASGLLSPDLIVSPNGSRLVAVYQKDDTADPDGIYIRPLRFPQPTLMLEVDRSEISETAGTAFATVTRSAVNTAGDLHVTLNGLSSPEAVFPTSVTIPAGQASQTFTVSAVDDVIVDGTQTVALQATADGFAIGTANLEVTDNDAVVTLSISTDTVSEADGSAAATATVFRNSSLAAPLLVNLVSSDLSELTVPESVTIPAGVRWTTVDLNAVDDNLIDGDQTVTLTATAAGHQQGTGELTVTSDDQAGIVVTESDGQTIVAETGQPIVSRDTARVALSARPVTNVVLSVESSDPGEVTVMPATLTFTADSWNQPQTVTFSGVPDSTVDGPQSTVVSFSVDPALSDDAFDTVVDSVISVSTTDTDTAGFTTSPDVLSVSESGTSETFSIQLDSAPLSDVVLNISRSDTGEVTVSPAILRFTAVDWNQPQTVTVRGLDDDMVDGSQMTDVLIAVNAAASADAFNAVSTQVVRVTTADNDVAALTLSRSTVSVSESGTSEAVTVVLDRAPLSSVVTKITASDPGEATVSSDLLTFTPSDWDVPQTVIISGADDDIVDGDQLSDIVVSVLSEVSDDAFDSLPPQSVSVTTTDNDVAGFTVDQATIAVSEAGTQESFAVVLDRAPLGNVVLKIVSSDTSEATVDPPALIFTPSNWNVPQNVTVRGMDDEIVDGPVNAAVAVTVEASDSDDAFDLLPAQSVSVVIADDDVAEFSLSQSSVTVSESGTRDSFTVRLERAPLSDVELQIFSSDTAEATVNPHTLTFTPFSWNLPQAVQVTGVDDPVVDGSQSTTVTVEVNPLRSDEAFRTMPQQTLSVTTTDDDDAGFTIQNLMVTVAESGDPADILVVLDSQPRSDVVLTVSNLDPNRISVGPDHLVFTPDRWALPQQIVVSAVNDRVVDGTQMALIRVSVDASASDAAFQHLQHRDVQVSAIDDDVPGFTLSDTSLSVSESGTTDSFDLVLDAAPLTDVVLTVSSSDAGEAETDTDRLTFTSENWNVPRSVTVSAVDDDVVDGSRQAAIVVGVDSGSSDAAFDAVAGQSVSVSVQDNDVAGFTLSRSAIAVAESESVESVAVTLNKAPLTDVVLQIAGDDAGEFRVSPAQLVFGRGNWNIAQSVTVTGVDDSIADGVQAGLVTVSVDTTVSDDAFDLVADQLIQVTNDDNETPGFLLSRTTLAVSEPATSDSFTVALTAPPLTDVILQVTSGNTSEATVVPRRLVFSSGDWDVPQTITVSAVDDAAVDGSQLVEVSVAVDILLSNEQFVGLPEQTVDVSVSDNDSASTTGDVDGDDDFDANDSFLIHLVSLAGTDAQVSQSSGSSPLSAAEIRAAVSTLQAAVDVDGDGDFDANDSFLIHLIRLAGTDQQIDGSKGGSPLTAIEIRARVGSLAPVSGSAAQQSASEPPAAAAFVSAASDPDSVSDPLFPKPDADRPATASEDQEGIDSGVIHAAMAEFRQWIDVL
ncbi:MAG: right-handed parallel beta-helix repeat-containing protein [Fuerstiella sp.]